MDRQTIYVNYGKDARKLVKRLLDVSGALDEARPGMSVALKPNLVVPGAASDGATTHPEIAEGVILALIERGVKNISIIESSWVGASTQRAFKICGYEELSKKYEVPLYDLKRDAVVEVNVGGEWVLVSKRAKETDMLINLPVLKAHCQTRLTCAIKNLKGCIPDNEKRRYHSQGLIDPIAKLGVALKPAFTLVDAICGDLTFEEGGTPVQMDMAFLGADSVMVDAFAASMLGYLPSEIPYIPLCEKLGGGAMKAEQIVTLSQPDDKSRENVARDAALEGTSNRARLIAGVHELDACSACVGALMRAKYRFDREGKRTAGKADIYIGQGYAEYKEPESGGIGIGRCCSKFSRCVPGCPPTAQAIYEELRH